MWLYIATSSHAQLQIMVQHSSYCVAYANCTHSFIDSLGVTGCSNRYFSVNHCYIYLNFYIYSIYYTCIMYQYICTNYMIFTLILINMESCMWFAAFHVTILRSTKRNAVMSYWCQVCETISKELIIYVLWCKFNW